MEYLALGKVAVRRDGEDVDLGPFRQRSLFALLLMNANSIVSTDRILEELWGEDVAADRQNALWVYVSNLRKALEPDRAPRSEGTILLTRSPGYVLNVDTAAIDTVVFEQLLEEGRRLAGSDPAAALEILREALSLWRGRAYEDFTYQSFAVDETARLAELRLQAIEARVEAELALGAARELVPELEALVRQHPLREELTGQLMVALYRCGRQSEALRAFALLRTRLGEELGIEPSAAVKAIEERIVVSDPSLDAPVGATGGETGLRARGYELRDEIDSSDTYVTYAAFQPSMGREVAVRVLSADVADDAAFIRRFERRARQIATLDHPRLLSLYDYWREPGAAYLVAPHSDSSTLSSILRVGALDSAQLAALVEDVGGALSATHDAGIVGFDLSTRSVRMESDGRLAVEALALLSPSVDSLRSEDLERSDLIRFADVIAEAATGVAGDVEAVRGALDPRVARALTRTRPDAGNPIASVDELIVAVLEALSGKPSGLPSVVSSRNPYKGLRSFSRADERDFFGREGVVERLLDRLRKMGARSRFIALVGPSGSGKSSVVRAGLLPSLAGGALALSEDWYVTEMTPAPDPFVELESALRSIAVDPPKNPLDELTGDAGGLRRLVRRIVPEESTPVLIVIDQFEELFTQVDAETANRFLDAIFEAVTHERSLIRIVATMRADFYDRPLRHREFSELLREGTEVITPMSPAELERAIRGPAELVGMSCEPALVATLIGEAADRAGALPLLQYAMTELFEAREGDALTMDTYGAIGGMTGALAETADRLYGSLEIEEQECARQVLLSLVSLGEGAEDTRRRISLPELHQLPFRSEVIDRVLDVFGRQRLLTFDRDAITRSPTVEVAHEALLRGWTRLGTWIDDARGDLRQQRALRRAATEWIAANRSNEYLLPNGRVAQFEEFAKTTTLSLTEAESEYLSASRAAVSRRLEADRLRAEHELALQRKAKRRFGAAAVFLAVGLVVSGYFGIEAARQQEAVETTLALRVAEALPSAANDARVEDPQLSLLLAGEALAAAVEHGLDLEDATVALHLALRSARVPFPTDHGGFAQVSAPEGPTAVFVLSLAELLALRDTALERSLTPGECATHLDRDCPDRPVEERLATSDLAASVIQRKSTAAGPLDQTSLALGVDPGLLIDFGGSREARARRLRSARSEWLVALSPIESATGIDVKTDFLSDLGTFDRTSPAVVVYPWVNPDAGDEQPYRESYVRAELVAVDLKDRLTLVGSDTRTSPWMTSVLEVNGATTGLWTGYDAQSVVWYRTDWFEASGLNEPKTWDELVAITDRLAADGRVAWCLGLDKLELGPGPTASGIDVVTLVASRVMAIGGLELFDEWIAHEVPANDPRIIEAHRHAGALIMDHAHNGGPFRVFGALPYDAGLFDETGSCAMHVAAASVVHEEARNPSSRVNDGPEIGVFALPTGLPNGAMLVGGWRAELLADTPEARALLSVLALDSVGRQIAGAGASTAIVADPRVLSSDYSDPLSRDLASAINEAVAADTLRLGIFEMEPGLFRPYSAAINRWMEEGDDALPGILAELEVAWAQLDAD